MRVTVRVTPKANHNRVVGLAELADGTAAVKVLVNVPPEGGKANRATCQLLAKALRLPKSSVTVAAGMRGRTKTLQLTGAQRDLKRRLEQWHASLGG